MGTRAAGAAFDAALSRQHLRPARLFVASLHIVPVMAIAAGIFSVDAGGLLPIYADLAILILCGLWLKQQGKPVLAAILEMSGLFYLAAVGTALTCAVMTASALPYADDRLAAADAALGFDWRAMFALFRSSPVASMTLARAYEGINWAPQLLIILLGLLRSPAQACRFLTAWMAGLAFTAILYPLFPAIAAFHHHGVSPEMVGDVTAQVSWDLPGIMEGLRSGMHRTLGAADLNGIVSMPSFHAAAAVILLHGYVTFSRLRWPSVALCVTMFAAAVPVGGHYLVEVITGFVLAVMAIGLAAWLHREPRANAAPAMPDGPLPEQA